MRNICIVSGADLGAPGGNSSRVTGLATGLQKYGFEVRLVVPEPSSKNYPTNLDDIKIHQVPITAKSNAIINEIGRAILLTREAKKIKKKTNAILQFEHSTLGGYAALMGCSNFILEVRDLAYAYPEYKKYPFLSRILYYIERTGIKKASKVIVVGNSFKEFIKKEWNAPEEKIEVIPPGYFESKVEQFKNIEETKGMITYLGSLRELVDIGKLITLAKSLKDKNTTLYIIGDGPSRGSFEEMAKKENLKNITFIGALPVDEAYELLAKSQICIFPLRMLLTTAFAQSIKIIDYAALGKAMVLDNVSDFINFLGENDAALVSNPSNQEEFIRNVHTLLEDEQLRKKIGANAKELLKDYSWENQAKKLAKVYEELDYEK